VARIVPSFCCFHRCILRFPNGSFLRPTLLIYGKQLFRVLSGRLVIALALFQILVLCFACKVIVIRNYSPQGYRGFLWLLIDVVQVHCKFASIESLLYFFEREIEVLWRKRFGAGLIPSLSLRSTTSSADPHSREIAKRKASHNRRQRVPVNLLRNRTGRATTRIYNIFCHGARLGPSTLRRFTRIAQYFGRLTGCGGCSCSSIRNYWLGVPGHCGGGCRGALHSIADGLSDLCHPRFHAYRIVQRRIVVIFLRPTRCCLRTSTFAAPTEDQPVAYLNSGSSLSPSLVPPGRVTLLPVNLSAS
jgi:hypothetical protein